MAFTLTQLEHFSAVVRHGSFSAAARSLSVAQPAISHSIAILEKDIGSRLFDRTSRNCSLTLAGTVFLADVERITHEINEVRIKMRKLGTQAVGRIVLGLTPGLSNLFGEVLLHYMSAQHPSVEVIVVEAYAARLRELLHDGRIDCAVTYNISANEENIRTRSLGFEPLHLIASPKLIRKALKSDLVDVPQIGNFPLFFGTLSDEDGIGRLLIQTSAQHGVPLNVHHQVQSLSISRRLLLSEQLATVLPVGVVIDELLDGSLVAMLINDPRYLYEVQFAVSKHRNFGQLENILEGCIEKISRPLLFDSKIWRAVKDYSTPANLSIYQSNLLSDDLISTSNFADRKHSD